MSGQGDPSGGGGDKNSYALLWVIALIMGAGFLIWWFYSEQLKVAFIYIRRWEAQLAALFTDKLDQLIFQLKTAVPDDVTMEAAAYVSNEVGSFLMYPSIGLLVLMSIYMLKNHSHMRWHTKHNMDSLARQEQKNWPQISPVVPIDLVEQDVNKGPWAMSLNPMEFAKKYKLLEVEKVTDPRAQWRGDGQFKATLIKERAYRVLASQMGPMWQGVNRLPPHTKALFSIFCARIEHQPDEARAYIYELAAEAAKGELHYRRTDEFLKKYGSAKAVQLCLKRHAYVYTMMASFLELARTDGVFASADFLWLKPIDRSLWYMLNTVGRQVAPAEVAGPWAHWLAEKEMHRALSVPMIEEAIKGLEFGLSLIVYQPDEDQEVIPAELPGGEEGGG